MHRPRSLALALALVPGFVLACARPQPSEEPAPQTQPTSPTTSEPSTTLPPDIFAGDPMFPRLEEVGKTYEAGVIERLALSDIAFPASPAEAIALQGHALVMITATTHVAAELPPRRVYTDCGGELLELTVVVKRVIPFEVWFSEVVGSTRYDAFYLLPVEHVARDECKLVIDWAINREGQVITEFDPVPSEVPVMPPMGVPEQDPVMDLLAREYPFLFAE